MRLFFAPSRPCVPLGVGTIAVLLLPRPRLHGLREGRGKLSLVPRAAAGGGSLRSLPPRRASAVPCFCRPAPGSPHAHPGGAGRRGRGDEAHERRKGVLEGRRGRVEGGRGQGAGMRGGGEGRRPSAGAASPPRTFTVYFHFFRAPRRAGAPPLPRSLLAGRASGDTHRTGPDLYVFHGPRAEAMTTAIVLLILAGRPRHGLIRHKLSPSCLSATPAKTD